MFILLIASILVSIVQCQTLFQSQANVNFYMGPANAHTIAVTPDESLILVGYDAGLIKAFSMSGNLMFEFSTGTTAAIRQILTLGPYESMTLDTSNTVNSWLNNGTHVLTTNLNSTIVNMALTYLGVTDYYTSYNFGPSVFQMIVQLNSTVINNTKNYVASNFVFTDIKYTGDSQYLIAGTNLSTVVVFNTSSGTITGNLFNVDSPVQQFSSLTPGLSILMTTNSTIYKFYESNFTPIVVGKATNTTAFSGCPSGLIVTGQNGSSHMSVFNANGSQVQTLQYATTTVKRVACTQNYLVSLDNSNYLAINQYAGGGGSPAVNKPFPVWAIGVIAGVGGLVLIGIVIVIVVCKRRRAKSMGQLSIGVKQLLSSPSERRD